MHSSTTVGVVAASSAKSGRAARARATKSSTASPSASVANGVTGTTRSAGIPRPSRLVAITRTSGALRRDRVHDRRDARDHVLAVVDHQQQVPPPQPGAQAGHVVFACRQRVAQRLQQHRGDAIGGVDRGQVREPGPVGEPRLEHGRDLEPEARLAHTAGARERDDRGVGNESRDLFDGSRAPHELVRLHGKVPHQLVARLQRRELTHQLGVRDLEHAFGLVEVAEAVLAEIEQLDPTAAHQLARRRRHHDLPAVRDAHQARRPVDRAAVVVAVARFRLARVQAHAHAERTGRVPRFPVERELRGDRGVDRVVGGVEGGVEPVPRRLDHEAVVTLDGVTHDGIVTRERLLHRLGVLLPEARRTLEIGEQEGDRSRRHLAHSHPSVA